MFMLFMIFLLAYRFTVANTTVVIKAVLPLGKSHYNFDPTGKSGWIIKPEKKERFSLYGTFLVTTNISLSFTTNPGSCEVERLPRIFRVFEDSSKAVVEIKLPSINKPFYLCTKELNGTEWIHHGAEPSVTITTAKVLLPAWAMSIFIIVLMSISGLFSGLNLGLMSLTPQDLDVIIGAGEDPTMIKYAKRIIPLRRRGNFLLCTILLGNVLVNSTATILLEEMIDGIYAIIGSTVGIVIFGEIIPQAICSRHGLLVGAMTVRLTKLFMILTFPISYPLSKILDVVLGAEVGSAYTRGQILELVKRTTKDIEQNEMAIVVGALALKTKKVSDLMTPLNEVFMLSDDSIVNSELIVEIHKKGFTRIPVYAGRRDNIVGLVNIRDFAFIDAETATLTVHNVCEFYKHPVGHVQCDANVLSLFEEFKQGNYHIALVQKASDDVKDKASKITVGIITLEDIIEEIVQSEIYDEWDYVSDGMSNKPHIKSRAPDFSVFLRFDVEGELSISPQLKIATYHFLSAIIEPFKPAFISQNVLNKLINNSSVTVNHKHPADQRESKAVYVYEYGKPADFFVLIMSGRACLETGKEKILSEVGPFSYFGVSALYDKSENIQELIMASKIKQRTIIPDFSLRLIQDTLYLLVRRPIWLAAVRASAFEKKQHFLNNDCQKAVNDFLAEELRKVKESDSAQTARRRSVMNQPGCSETMDSATEEDALLQKDVQTC